MPLHCIDELEQDKVWQGIRMEGDKCGNFIAVKSKS
jgi:hypothetical protein